MTRLILGRTFVITLRPLDIMGGALVTFRTLAAHNLFILWPMYFAKEAGTNMKAAQRVVSIKTQSGVGLAPQFMRMAAVQDLANTLLTEIKGIGELTELNLAAGINMKAEMRRYEIELIRLALQLNGNNQVRAARMLGIKPTTLNAKIKRFRIHT
jgi:hypothetical protein